MGLVQYLVKILCHCHTEEVSDTCDKKRFRKSAHLCDF